MKTCLFIHTFPRFTGDISAPFMWELAYALVAKGHKVYVLVPDDSLIKKENMLYELVTYRYFYPRKLQKLGYSRTLKGDKELKWQVYFLAPFLYFFAFLALVKLVQKKHIDLVSSHWIIPDGFIASIASKVTKVPFTTTIPGSDIYMDSKNFLFRFFVNFVARNASWVISDSKYYLEELESLGFKPKRAAVIFYGVNIAKFKPRVRDKKLLAELNFDKKDLTILAVGRMVSKKGFIYLIEAMPMVLRKKSNVKLLLIGEGDEKEKLEKRVKQLGIAKNVVFVWPISYIELSKYYYLEHVFVMPSVRDGKGNIDASPLLLEAMACGIPVAATKFSGNESMVINGQTGFLVQEKNSKEIAESIIKLLLKPNKSLIKKKVRKVAVRNFSTGSVGQRYTEIFKTILDEKQA